MRVVDVFMEQCRRCPNDRALQILSAAPRADAYTWAELQRLMFHTTSQLQDASGGILRVGDHVATWLPNGLAWILVDLACQWMGWVHVALDRRLPASRVADLVQHSHSKLLVSDGHHCTDTLRQLPILTAEQLEQRLEQQLVSSHNDDQPARSANIDQHHPAQLMYTSGTISQPKGALLSHRNLLSNARAKLLAAPQHPDDVRLNILPFAHAYARTCELSAWILSGSELCIAAQWESWLNWAPIIQPTLINLVPQLVYRLAEQFRKTQENGRQETGTEEHKRLLGTRLRLLQVGGAALREEVWQQMAALGWPPLQGYGLTETAPVICSNRAGQQRYDSVGAPVEGVEVRLDDQSVLWTRGPHVMLGYWQDPEATAQKMQADWFCTGDLAEQLPDGSLRILGRMDDQITLSTGYKVPPLELTRRLSADPWLEHVVLVGQDRPYVSALIYPRYASIPLELFATHAREDALELDEFCRLIIARWHDLTHDLPRFMHVERVAIMKQPPSVDNGGLNFKGAIRRRFIEQELCRDEVEQIYGNGQLSTRSSSALET